MRFQAPVGRLNLHHGLNNAKVLCRFVALNKVAAVLVVVIVALAGVFVYTYSVSQAAIASRDSTISSQSSMISSQQAQISGQLSQMTQDTAKIGTLNATINTDNAQIANLTALVNADVAKIQALNSGYAKANSTINSLQAQVTTLTSTINSLNGQVSTLNTQITALQAQVSQDSSIIGLKIHTAEFASKQYIVPANGNVTVGLFNATYPGYIIVSMTQDSDINHVGFLILDHYASDVIGGHYSGVYSSFLYSQTPDALSIAVTPGIMVVYAFTDSLVSGTITLSVDYYA
jgi:hypothetical protein